MRLSPALVSFALLLHLISPIPADEVAGQHAFPAAETSAPLSQSVTKPDSASTDEPHATESPTSVVIRLGWSSSRQNHVGKTGRTGR
jgi:hypothetical protein